MDQHKLMHCFKGVWQSTEYLLAIVISMISILINGV